MASELSRSHEIPVPTLDLKSDTWSPDEKAQMLRWYMTAQGTGDTSLAKFAPFMIEYNPAGFKRYRSHQLNLGTSVPASLLFLHSYAVVGNKEGVLYMMVSCKQSGFTKPQVLETLSFAFLSGGPQGMNAVADECSSFLFAWEDSRRRSKFKWPHGWAADPGALKSGLDLTSDQLTRADVRALQTWYIRFGGEIPPHVNAWARLHGQAYKTNRLRYETGFGVTLPAQLFPLFTLHLATFSAWPKVVRRALMHARALGVNRRNVLETMEMAFVYGGEAKMEEVLTSDVIEVLDTFAEGPET